MKVITENTADKFVKTREDEIFKERLLRECQGYDASQISAPLGTMTLKDLLVESFNQKSGIERDQLSKLSVDTLTLQYNKLSKIKQEQSAFGGGGVLFFVFGSVALVNGIAIGASMLADLRPAMALIIAEGVCIGGSVFGYMLEHKRDKRLNKKMRDTIADTKALIKHTPTPKPSV